MKTKWAINNKLTYRVPWLHCQRRNTRPASSVKFNLAWRMYSSPRRCLQTSWWQPTRMNLWRRAWKHAATPKVAWLCIAAHRWQTKALLCASALTSQSRDIRVLTCFSDLSSQERVALLSQYYRSDTARHKNVRAVYVLQYGILTYVSAYNWMTGIKLLRLFIYNSPLFTRCHTAVHKYQPGLNLWLFCISTELTSVSKDTICHSAPISWKTRRSETHSSGVTVTNLSCNSCITSPVLIVTLWKVIQFLTSTHFFLIGNGREEDGEWNGRVLLREINFIAFRVQLPEFSKLTLFGFKHIYRERTLSVCQPILHRLLVRNWSRRVAVLYVVVESVV
jgi:hypothetical protein